MTAARILVVDDEPDVEVMLVQRFRRQIRDGQYEFVFARDGLDALDVLGTASAVDMVVSDINMPRMDGLTLLDQLNEMQLDLKTIIVSAYGDMRNIRTAMNRGAFDFVTKPIEFDDLRAVIDKTLAQLEEERIRRRDELKLLEITSALTSELNLDELLVQIMNAATELLSAERSTLFLYDEEEDVLWSRVAEGMEKATIKVNPDEGIAGHAFRERATINLADARDDPRFNPKFDMDTGFETRSMLTMPILNKGGRTIGVVQALNKIDGVFTEHDEKRLRALSAQAVIAIENARLFEDVLNMRNYNEGILQSLSNGVVSLDSAGTISKANASANRILGSTQELLVGRGIGDFCKGANAWILDAIARVERSKQIDLTLDTELVTDGQRGVSVNLTVVPLSDINEMRIGNLLVFEDISAEKRVRSTMSRYMPKAVVDRMLDDGADALDGASEVVTVLFSDIRGFTTISELIGPRATVTMLNEYFSEMVEVIDRRGGILDKYIGDAIMALFGVPFTGADDARNAVRAADEMLVELTRLNERRTKRGDEPIRVGIGLNTGEVIVGNIGTARRLDYTAIGDAVNLAARIESATKMYGAPLLISQFTYEDLPDADREDFREIDQLRVKGKEEPISVYQGLKSTPAVQHPESRKWLDLDAKGIAAYRAREWDRARELFAGSLAMAPDNMLPGIYLQRIEQYRLHEPDPDWDGVWSMESK